MYSHNIPFWVPRLYPNYRWHGPEREEPTVYLTFDDGPIPEVTPWVLETLENEDVKGTFFCVGENVLRHPTIAQEIKAAGHSLGNHTHTHINGWSTNTETYLSDALRAKEALEDTIGDSVRLFRPPYGRVRKAQATSILGQHEIVMWSVLTGDFDLKLQPVDCLRRAIKYTRPGGIVVFHDSLKAEERIKGALRAYIQTLKDQGYSFGVL